MSLSGLAAKFKLVLIKSFEKFPFLFSKKVFVGFALFHLHWLEKFTTEVGVLLSLIFKNSFNLFNRHRTIPMLYFFLHQLWQIVIFQETILYIVFHLHCRINGIQWLIIIPYFLFNALKFCDDVIFSISNISVFSLSQLGQSCSGIIDFNLYKISTFFLISSFVGLFFISMIYFLYRLEPYYIFF